jgi:outer membrane receptor for ferrienterochelin and colicins
VASHIAFDPSKPRSVMTDASDEVLIELTPRPWMLDDVVVTGTRSPHLLKDVPVQTEVVTRRDFQRTGATTVDEALTSAIGLTVGQDFSGQGASIRGVQQDRVLVMVDGERAVGRVNGSIDLSQYALTSVEKIEVVKGTGSTLYGSDAIGGVINIITRRPGTNTSRADIYADFGSHTSYNPAVDLEYGGDRIGVSLGGKLQSTDGFDLDQSTPHTNGESAATRLNLNGKVRAELSPAWSLTGSARFMNEDLDWIESEVRELSVIRDTVYVYDDAETNRRFEGSTSLEYLAGDSYHMKLRLFGTLYQHNWNKFGDNGRSWVDTSETEDRYLEAAYTANLVIADNHVATYGADVVYQDLTSTELSSANEADRSIAGYLQYEYRPVAQVTILPGIRWEDHSSFGSTVNPSFNLMYRPSDQIKLRGFVGRGYRAPSIKQQYFVFDHTAAGYVVYGGRAPLPTELTSGDGSFKPLTEEHSINSSVSAEFSYGSIGMHRVTYFYNHLEDLIDFSLIGFTPTYWRGVYVYQNIETAITQGIEWESRVRLSKSVDIQFSYGYLHSHNLDTGEKLVGRPDHTVKLFLSGYSDRLAAGASLWGDWHSRKVWVATSNTGGNEDIDSDSPPEYAPSRTRLNLNLFKRFENGLEAFVRIENILNDTEVAYGYWPGRQIIGGFRCGFTLAGQ